MVNEVENLHNLAISALERGATDDALEKGDA